MNLQKQGCSRATCIFDMTRYSCTKHCVKSFRIRSFSGLCFPAFQLNTKRYGEPFRIQSENTDQKNSTYGHFSRIECGKGWKQHQSAYTLLERIDLMMKTFLLSIVPSNISQFFSTCSVNRISESLEYFKQ